MIHNVSYRTFVYGTENEEKVKKAVKTLFPNSSPQMEYTEGYWKNPVLILHDKIEKRRRSEILSVHSKIHLLQIKSGRI